MECESCERLKGNNNLICETNYWKISLNPEQRYVGRSVVALKRHCEDLSNLTKEELLDFHVVVKNIETTIKKAFNATLFNWGCLMNDTYQKENPTPHVHWHLRPRYKNPVLLEGILFEDKEFGYHYNREEKRFVPKEVQEKIIKKMKSEL